MKVTDVYFAGLGVYQAPTVDAGKAARRGEYDRSSYLENRLTGVCVAGDISAPDMAVEASRQAISRAGADPARIAMVLHATVWDQGPDMWHSPAYIQKQLIGNAVPAFEVGLGCNGVFAGLELAAPRMGAMGAEETVLLTTAENFGSPRIDRWNGAVGFLVGDAGGALLLSRESGFARLLSVGSATVPELEQLNRGAEPMNPAFVVPDKKIEARERALYFRENVMPLTDAVQLSGRAQVDLIERTLMEADRKLDDMLKVVYSNAAGYLTEQFLLEPLGIPMERTTWQFGRGIGHTGASDQLLSLNHLLLTGRLEPGDHVLLAGAGPAAVSSAVVEILEIPGWARA